MVISLWVWFLAQAALRAPPEVALQCVAGHRYYQLSLFLYLFFFFSPPSFAFEPLWGKLPRLKISFPQYFGITRRYMQIITIIIFIFYENKWFSSGWPLFSPTFWSRRACVRHTWWRTKRSWPFFHLLFSSSFFFFSAFFFGESPVRGNLFGPIFWLN